MRRYVTYKRVSSKEQGKSGLGLDAQERDIQLFLCNYAETPYEVLGEFVEVHSGQRQRTTRTPRCHRFGKERERDPGGGKT